MSQPPNMPALIKTDGTNDFALRTMRQRHPKMIQNVIDANEGLADAILDELLLLRHDLQNDGPLQLPSMFPTPTPDYVDWVSAYLERQERAGKHLTWNNVDWFFAETFMFRTMIDLTRWWETRRDPFAPMKQAELDSKALWDLLEHALNLEGGVIDRLPALLKLSMWGNRIDLSYEAASALGAQVDDDEHVLIDDSEAVREHLLRAQLEAFPDKTQGIAHLIVDNFGTELAMDLTLVDALLTGFSDVVILHVKFHPTFVSDATDGDVRYMLHRLATGMHHQKTIPAVQAMGQRLQQAFEVGRLRLAPHLFWNGPQFMWEMPRVLARVFEGAQVVIIKGDANYRRTIGDAIWRPETRFADVTTYFPAPLLALRTLKSDPIVGLPAGRAGELTVRDKDWRVSGKYGIVQLKV